MYVRGGKGGRRRDVGRSVCDAKSQLWDSYLFGRGLWREGVKQHMQNLCFSWGFLYDLRLMVWLCLCLHTYTEGDQASMLRSSARTVSSHAARLHEADNASAPASLGQTYPADSRLHRVRLLFGFRRSSSLRGQAASTANSKRMKEIKEIYVFFKDMDHGEGVADMTVNSWHTFRTLE